LAADAADAQLPKRAPLLSGAAKAVAASAAADV